MSSRWGVTLPSGPCRPLAVPRLGAAEALADFAPGRRVVGMNRGQFSLGDLLRAVLLDHTGPADVTIAAWAAGKEDIRLLVSLARQGQIRRLRWFLDRSFARLHPDYTAEIVRDFGDGSVVVTNNHAKVVLVGNEEWAVSIRSSMNMNRNRRLEQFDIDDNRAIHDFFAAAFDEVAAGMGLGPAKGCGLVTAVFDGLTFGEQQDEGLLVDDLDLDDLLGALD